MARVKGRGASLAGNPHGSSVLVCGMCPWLYGVPTTNVPPHTTADSPSPLLLSSSSSSSSSSLTQALIGAAIARDLSIIISEFSEAKNREIVSDATRQSVLSSSLVNQQIASLTTK